MHATGQVHNPRMKWHVFLLTIYASLVFPMPTTASTQPMEQQTLSQSPRHPVVLVHGFKDTSRKMQFMASYLRKQGWTVYTPTLSPSWGQIGLDELAGQLSTFIDTTLKPGEKFDLVGFSMGGLVCRYYLQKLDGAKRVDHFVTLGAPHRGSLWAWVVPNPGCRQMRPGSVFMNDLNGNIDTLGVIKFTSIWTPFDLIILPAASSEIPRARNERMNVIIHPLLVFDRRCLSAVADALKG